MTQDNFVLSLQTNHRDQNRVYSVITVSKFIVKGSGEDPSFDRKLSVGDFKYNLSDGNLFHAKSENTHFVFVPAVVQLASASPEKKETEESRSYYDPFERRARTVSGGENEMSSTSRTLFVFVLDAPKPDILKVAQLKFDEFPSISKWSHMSVSFLSRLPGNRLAFLAVFDEYKYFIICTRKNSLAMKVAHKGETAKKEPVVALVESSGYLYVLKKDRIEVCRIEDGRISAIIEASDREEKTDASNKDFLRVVQTIPLSAEPASAPKALKVLQLNNGSSLLVLLSGSEVTLFAAHIFEADKEPGKARLISRYYEAARGSMQDCLLLDFEVLDRRSFEAPANKDHSSYQILVVGIDEAGKPVKFTIPFCLPNYLLHHSAEASVCKQVSAETDNQFSLGFQNNEVHSCASTVEGLALQRAYSCGERSAVADFALETERLQGDLGCLGDEARACNAVFRTAPKDPGCESVTDCFNCSMVPKCRWNNELHSCGKFTHANTTENFETFGAYLSTVAETGLAAMDLASIKLYFDCPKPVDLKVEPYHSKDYFNVSLSPLAENQFSLVVRCSDREPRLCGILRHRRGEREPAVPDKDRALQRHSRAGWRPEPALHPERREGRQPDELQREEVACAEPGRPRTWRNSTS